MEPVSKIAEMETLLMTYLVLVFNAMKPVLYATEKILWNAQPV
jgi:hypothetical protein